MAAKKKKVDPEREAKRAEALRIRQEALAKAGVAPAVVAQQDPRAQPSTPKSRGGKGRAKNVDPGRQARRAEALRVREEALAAAQQAPAPPPPKPAPVRAPVRPRAPAPAPAPPPARAPVRARAPAPARKPAPARSPVPAPPPARAPAKKAARLTEEDVRNMKVVDLKAVLREHGLKVSGLKADLIKRVLEEVVK